MNSIEEKLWNYIDGTCTTDEHNTISLLIEQNETYRDKYLELLSFNADMGAIELEEPSMAFTYKVMENIRADYARQPLKTRINNNIVKAIGGFFVFTIAAILVYIMVNINWSAGTPVNMPEVIMPDAGSFMHSAALKGFLFFDVVLLLFLFDGFLRKRNFAKQA
jgi:hypothetical protein